MKKIIKTTLILILILLNSNLFAYQYTHEKEYNWSHYKRSIQFRVQYTQTINKLKIREGFRAKRYNDHGWDCIGYGQRTKFYPGPIPEIITEKQADLILRKSFYRHLKLVKRKWPFLRGKKLIDYAYLSYINGIGRIKV
jgi:hypothetical protein